MDGAQAAADVQGGAVHVELARGVPVAVAGGDDGRAQHRQADLPAVGVAGEHQVDAEARGVADDVGAVREQEAEAVYEEACRVAQDLGQRRLLWPLLMRLSEFAAERGQAEQAAAMRRQAREIVTDIGAHTPGEWRASFLALPHVRAALDG